MSEQHSKREHLESPEKKARGGCGGAPGSLSCAEICSFLCDYVDGTLEGPSKAAFDAHVAGCAHCKEYLETYAETIRLSKRCCCPKLQPPPPLPEDMIAAIVRAAGMSKGQGCTPKAGGAGERVV
jgi:hypothetical protein